MTEIELRELLAGILLDEDGAGVQHCESYTEAGLATSAQGLVLYMEDGRQFQLTILQSK